MTVQVTVEISTDDKEHARRLLEEAGFVVARLTLKRAAARAATLRTPGHRASARTDTPDGLNVNEDRAYVRGYGKGCTAWAKKFGAPSGSVETPWAELRERTVTYEWDRHESCHKAGLNELQKWREHWSAHRSDLAARADRRMAGAA